MKNITKQRLITIYMSLSIPGMAMAAAMFTPDSQPTGWLAKPVVTFFDVSTGNEAFYQLDYRKDTWAGNVLAKNINANARVQTTGPWDNLNPTLATAASFLNTANFSSGRKIATMGHAFRWANLSSTEQTAIGSEAVMNYIRGDRSNEEPKGLSLRFRESVLGDILHSSLYFWDHGNRQSLYVGSNDGMLHSFDANTGVENFAYIPSTLIPNLKKLAAKPYVHTHFVDGPINIANVDVSGTQKTILVGALGAGGEGLYALDISSPTATSEANVAAKVMWEITGNGSYSAMGHIYGTPLITRLASGKAVVITGNGYMNPGNGHAVLYIINAISGVLISAIDTGSGSSASPNGLSSPALYDKDGDARPDYAYAGDIDGNLWEFDLVGNSAKKVFTTSPTQAITTAPVVRTHPHGGRMVSFATGRILTSGDESDVSQHYVYGIWASAPVGNTKLVSQTLTTTTFGSQSVRTVSSNALDWTSGNDKGWKVALRPGERVVGEKPFYNNGRFYFLTTNPTVDLGENWLHELVFNTGGSPQAPIFDLNLDGVFDGSDLATNGHVPMAKYLGSGIFSQPLLVHADKITTTLYTFHPDLPVENGLPTEPVDPGISGGHFDFDIYYADASASINTPTGSGKTTTICARDKDIKKEYYKISSTCVSNFDADFAFLSDYSVSKQKCGGKKNKYIDITCNTYTSISPYADQKHEHEYDDTYDVTGVNMLNASLIDFNLINAIPSLTTKFKVLVMNQYLNPAAKISLGGKTYESVKTFGGLASQTDAGVLLSSLNTYTRENIKTLIYNLPLDAFSSKDWWGDGGAIRAGLMPTQTGCVNKVNADGTMANIIDTSKPGKSKGKIGPNGERFDGALTIQIIKATTPSSALELNHNGADGSPISERVKYGWRVKQADFNTFVLAEYTSFWHHPNKQCYGDADWVADPPEDFVSDATPETPAPGSADPKDGVFGAGLAITDVTTTVSGLTTTTTTTYSDGSEYVKVVTTNDDGSTTIYQLFRDGTEETVTVYTGDGGHAGFIDPSSGAPEEEKSTGDTGRQTWRDRIDG